MRPLHPTPIVEKRVGMQADPHRDAQNRQWRKKNLAEGAPQTPMRSHHQGIHATLPYAGIDLSDDAASEASSRGTGKSLVR